jgi:hypothetical protein
MGVKSTACAEVPKRDAYDAAVHFLALPIRPLEWRDPLQGIRREGEGRMGHTAGRRGLAGAYAMTM